MNDFSSKMYTLLVVLIMDLPPCQMLIFELVQARLFTYPVSIEVKCKVASGQTYHAQREI